MKLNVRKRKFLNVYYNVVKSTKHELALGSEGEIAQELFSAEISGGASF